jgi:phage shock protein E
LPEGLTVFERLGTGLAAVLLMAAIAQAANHTDDSLDKVRKNLKDNKAVLIDVREPAEWNRGHLEEASLVPLSELRKLPTDEQVQKKHAPSLPKDRIIYCHCGSGVRVLTAAAILGKLGYEIRPLAAGFEDLLEAGFPQAKKP